MNVWLLAALVALGFTSVYTLECFECDSGDPKRANFDCPSEGHVSYRKLPLIPCHGKCYIRTKWTDNGAIIQRGCLPTTWLKRFLEDGCDILGEDIWCFCSQYGCNGRRLGEWFPIL